jgi:hypothetical protein
LRKIRYSLSARAARNACAAERSPLAGDQRRGFGDADAAHHRSFSHAKKADLGNSADDLAGFSGEAVVALFIIILRALGRHLTLVSRREVLAGKPIV